ncbi:hypothetical protein COO60DRAFT_1459085 [Scenedesmus sp. NREL 46B-D3]|nr:hypothetical protein COO60DRAFT_1459085 [Scenedesmus sp. NREL 46B-D3]
MSSRRQEIYAKIDDLSAVVLQFLDSAKLNFMQLIDSYRKDVDGFCDTVVTSNGQEAEETLKAISRLQRAQRLLCRFVLGTGHQDALQCSMTARLWRVYVLHQLSHPLSIAPSAAVAPQCTKRYYLPDSSLLCGTKHPDRDHPQAIAVGSKNKPKPAGAALASAARQHGQAKTKGRKSSKGGEGSVPSWARKQKAAVDTDNDWMSDE